MTFDLQRILDSKRAFRQKLARRPVSEKLAMLDALRERTLAIRSGSCQASAANPRVLEPIDRDQSSNPQ